MFVVIAGFLVWLRSRYQPPMLPKVEEQVQVSVQSTPTATPSAVPSGEEATGSTKQKISTQGATNR